MSIVIKATNKKVWGVKVTLPDGLGVQTPSPQDGTFELEDDQMVHAKNLVKDHNGLYVFAIEQSSPGVTGKQTTKSLKEDLEEIIDLQDEDQLGKSAEDQDELGGTDENELTDKGSKEVEEDQQEVIDEETEQQIELEDAEIDEEEQQYRDVLSAKTRKELEELCKPFPGSEWRGSNKEELIEYLVGKMKNK